MQVLIIATFAFLLNYIFYRKKLIEYEIIAATIYLISYIFIHSFEIIYVIYLAFYVLPYLNRLASINGKTFLILSYVGIELLVGFSQGSFQNVSAIFLTRYFPLLFLLFINCHDSREINGDRNYEQRILQLVACCDILVALFLVFLHDPAEEDIFIVAHQPVGANLSLVGALLLLDISYTNCRKDYRIRNIILGVVFIGLSLISGVRGYIIIVIPCALLSIYNFLWGNDRKRGMAVTFIFVTIVGAFVIFHLDRVVNLIYEIDTDIGYRSLENAYFKEVMLNSSLSEWLFGYGIGVSGESFGGVQTIGQYADTDFYYEHLQTMSALLNFWYTVVKDMGLLGGLIFLLMFYRISRSKEKGNRQFAYNLYVVLYATMLLFRTSCTNGVIELYMIHMISKNVSFHNVALTESHVQEA